VPNVRGGVVNPLTWPIRIAVACVGWYIDRAVRRLHDLDLTDDLEK
jgi:hypothetical protein